MKIKKSEILDILIWFLVGFYTLIGHWIWFGRGIQETIIMVLAIIQVIRRSKYNKYKKNKKGILILSAIFIVYVAIVTIKAPSVNYIVEDLKAIISAVAIYVYLFSFLRSNHDKCMNYITLACKSLTWYMWINTFVIILQYFIPYFMMNRAALTAVGNSAYWDHLTGFIGVNGTTRWNILSCIVVVFYIANAKNNRDWVKTISFIGISFIVSIMNSARSFLIMMPLFVMAYYILIKKKSVSTVFKYVIWAIGILASIVVVYYSVPFVKAYIDDLIVDKLAIYTSRNFAYMVGANDDRAVAINYAIQSGGTFGKGIGSIPMHYSTSLVKYMGLNSASSFIYMIGIVGYFTYSIILGIGTQSFMKKKSLIQTVGFIAIWLVISYLLPAYSSIILMLGTAVIFAIFEDELRPKSRKIR